MSRHFIALHPNIQRHHVPSAGECPDCLQKLDGASGHMGRAPEPGDFSVCAFCGCILRYEDGLALRRSSDDELDELAPEQRELLLRYHKAFRLARNEMAQLGGPQALVLKIPHT